MKNIGFVAKTVITNTYLAFFFRGCKQANLSTIDGTKISNLLLEEIAKMLKYQKRPPG